MNLPQLPAPPVPYISAAVEKVQQLFPLKKELGLNIYGIVSAHTSVAALINEKTCQLVLTGAYSLEEAFTINHLLLQDKLGEQFRSYKLGVLVTSVGYEQMVPTQKMIEMIDTIERAAKKDEPDKQAKSVQEMESYARYLFDKAEASPFEKGILTNILGRFRAKVMHTK